MEAKKYSRKVLYKDTAHFSWANIVKQSRDVILSEFRLYLLDSFPGYEVDVDFCLKHYPMDKLVPGYGEHKSKVYSAIRTKLYRLIWHINNTLGIKFELNKVKMH